MKKSFVLHLDSLCILDEMTNEQAGILFKSIYLFQNNIETELDFGMKMAFAPFKNQFIRDNESYLKTIERNSSNGLKGGRPTKNPNNPLGLNKTQKTHSVISKPKKADSDSDSDSVNENDNESKKEKKNKKEKKDFGDESPPADLVYSECMKIYNDFILDKTSLPAKIDGQQGKALKGIISYFKSIENVKSGERSVQDCIAFVFKEWDRVEPFIKDKLKLSEINSNLTNIINQIKNGKSNSTETKQQQIANQHAEQRRRILDGSL